MRMPLEPLDDHEIDGTQFLKQIIERWLRLPLQFVDNGPAAARYDGDLAGAGAAMQPGILARLVGVELMMRVLDGRKFQAALDQHRDHLGDQRGLAGAAPASEADNAHADIIWTLGQPVPCQVRGYGRGSPRPATRL